MTHTPTGIKAQCQDHKSKDANTKTAFRRLAEKLSPIMKREELKTRFAAGTKRVRTYSATSDTVRDHRIDKTYRYSDVIEGSGLQALLEDLQLQITKDFDLENS